MKIANKITSLLIFLLGVLLINTMVGLVQLSNVSRRLTEVAVNDVALLRVINAIEQYQYEKAILFERILRAAEELSADNVPASRRIHLLDHARFTKEGFDQLSQHGAAEIIKGKEIIEKMGRFMDEKFETKAAKTPLMSVEQAHIQYDALMVNILDQIISGNFQLSFDDIKSIQLKERKVAKELSNFLNEVEDFIQRSLNETYKIEQFSKKVSWLSFLISLVISFILAVSITRSISRPLKALVNATHQVGVGNLAVNLKVSAKDEIGELSAAFNQMSEKILEFKSELENKNEILAQNLKITEEQKRDLEKVNKELDRFVHTVSHDLRSPLMGISGYGSVLDSQYKEKLDSRGQRCIQGIKEGAKRINTMIEDLLMLTKISRIKNPYEEVDMNELVQEIVKRLEFNIQERQVNLVIVQELPIVKCDRIKMGEVFHNLINNAVKFSSNNSARAPQVDIGCQELDEAYQFYVRDNGIGIAVEDQDKVFEIFQRSVHAGEYKGTGVGLSIVREVIQDHGGKVWIESELGQGAAFFFTIPKKLS
ncbi:MAG: HAMP domain-containing protein [Candidatus Omnitrophica bacterium]|nr:HAMP domain-containing protein [Candidatus Omnitrophota bacterium]MCB9747475.1 HAMP domain-containing protein [Candidatus Omnitrophota bacterium]